MEAFGEGYMIEQDDWRLLHSRVSYLKMACINPTDGEEVHRNAPYLEHCVFCFEPVQDCAYQHWFLPVDLSCCICETCFRDFSGMFQWRLLDGFDLDWGD